MEFVVEFELARGLTWWSATVMERIILRSFQSPGDIVMLTAAVRDLHAAHPHRFATDVRTSADELWLHNPRLTPLSENDTRVRTIDMHYPLIHYSNQRPYHFLHGYAQFLEDQLGLRIPVTRFAGDIHLSDEEKSRPPEFTDVTLPERFWILIAGGKYDFTAKWWNPASYQAVVNHFRGRITFVQCGASGHWHPRLDNVISLVGKTNLRQFVHLMHWAEGVLCPVTFAMHLAAAVETRPGQPRIRPCVVVAGGREPAHWEAYPGHQFLCTNGTLPCCQTGGCWKSRCQKVGDGDPKDARDLCEQPVDITGDLRIAGCMHRISAHDVIRNIETYYEGGVMDNRHGRVLAPPPPQEITAAKRTTTISVRFFHGLGDCVYFAHLIPLYVRRGHRVAVECTQDKAVLFRAAGAELIASGADQVHPWGYPPGGTFEGHGRFWQGSKMGHNISEPPLPHIGAKEELWREYCDSKVDLGPHLSPVARETAERWLANLPRPVTLLHTKGNTDQLRKSLPDEVVTQFYREFLDRVAGSLVLLDWDNRVPRLASYRIRHLTDFGTCDTETLLALQERADLMVGVDSGPLHTARFTDIPTIGVWMPGHYPSTYTLPRREQLNVVLADETRTWNRFKRIPWNIVEQPGSAFRADWLAEICVRMLEKPRYLSERERAADVQLRQFIGEWCRGVGGNSLSAYCDRNRSFDVLFQESSRRFTTPRFVETGVIRAEEDWGGAGFFTYLAGAYLSRRAGKLDAVDISHANCRFARDWTAVFGDAVTVHEADSVDYLRRRTQPIDVLYLDSLDTTERGHAEHAWQETEAALPRLHKESLIVFDDTPWNAGAWVGKGAMAVPFLLHHGWRILYAGYQVILTRGDA